MKRFTFAWAEIDRCRYKPAYSLIKGAYKSAYKGVDELDEVKFHWNERV